MIEEVRRSFKATRQESRRVGYLAGATFGFAVLAFAAVILAGAATWYASEAQTETAVANGQTRLAMKAEADAHQLPRELLQRPRQVAMRRGNWKEARDGLQRAIDSGHRDRNRLLLEMVKVKSALYEVSEAETILRSLEGRPDLSTEERGMVLLWQGDFELSRSFQAGEDALKHFRKAIEANFPRPSLPTRRGCWRPRRGRPSRTWNSPSRRTRSTRGRTRSWPCSTSTSAVSTTRATGSPTPRRSSRATRPSR